MSAFQKAVRDLKRGVSLMIGRAVLTAVNDAGGIQLMQAGRLADETAGDLERFAEYGFTSVPHPEAQLIVASLGGVRSHGVVIATGDRRYRLKGLQTGEVALYDDLDQIVKLGRDGITIQTSSHLQIAAGSVEINADTIDLVGDVLIAGDLQVTSNTDLDGNLTVDGNSNLGGPGALAVKRVDDTPSPKVKA